MQSSQESVQWNLSEPMESTLEALCQDAEEIDWRAYAAQELSDLTKTIDFIQVLEGELWLVLENGEESQLVAGDCVVQRGTVHAWRNRSPNPTTFIAVLVAADEATLPASPLGPEALHG